MSRKILNADRIQHTNLHSRDRDRTLLFIFYRVSMQSLCLFIIHSPQHVTTFFFVIYCSAFYDLP